MRSESFPKRGHAMNAKTPLNASIRPTMTYVQPPNRSTIMPGSNERVRLIARYSWKRTGSTRPYDPPDNRSMFVFISLKILEKYQYDGIRDTTMDNETRKC
jgi:hypothetical protein